MTSKIALLHLGFRPFFLAAGVYAVLSTFLWMGIYIYGWKLGLNGIPATTWHAHEMIFGYAMAVVAGFMLTAVRNWTDKQTLNGMQLLSLVLLWAMARVLSCSGAPASLYLMGGADILFALVLLIHCALLIIKADQRRQLVILLVLLLMLVSNTVFYAGLLVGNYDLVNKGLYSGLYLIVTLIVVMGGRVIPFFIERGVGYPVQLRHSRWLDIAATVLFVVYWIADIYTQYHSAVAMLCGVLFLLHCTRMMHWYTRGIWKKPLLWVLYIGYGFILIGFLLKIGVAVFGISPLLAVHAFAYGCVGTITLGMMCRVIWGHTGREITNPPRALPWIFIPLIIGALVRVVLPLLAAAYYALWIGLSQLFWMVAFALFLAVYAPILVKPRIDGKYG